MRKINSIFIHHSASEFGNVKLIEEWHKEKGYKTIGYHFVVLNGFPSSESYKKKNVTGELVGFIEKGRPVQEVGAHVEGYNSNSIGICLVHDEKPYSETQLKSYRTFTARLAQYFNIDIHNIKGHYEVDKNKPLCPSLDMNKERELIAEKILHVNQEILELLEHEYNLKG